MTRVVIIEPTHKVGSEGYYEALVRLGYFNEEHKFVETRHWRSDSVRFDGCIHTDFEANGCMQAWTYNDSLQVQEGYTTIIRGSN